MPDCPGVVRVSVRREDEIVVECGLASNTDVFAGRERVMERRLQKHFTAMCL